MQLHERADRALKVSNQANYISYNTPELVVSQRAKSHPVDTAASISSIIIVFPGKTNVPGNAFPSFLQAAVQWAPARSDPTYGSTPSQPSTPNTGPSTRLQLC